MAGERLTPPLQRTGEQQQRIPVDVLKPQMDALIEGFRGKLAHAPEFQSALVQSYLYGQQVNLEEVEFQRGNHHYFVYLKGVPVEADEELEASLNRGVGPYTGWKILRIQRSPSEGYNPGYVDDEYLEMRIAPSESEYDKTETRYNNYKEHVKEVNTLQALERAKEIIDSF